MAAVIVSIGPNRPLNQPSNAAAGLPQTGRSCIVQQFRRLRDRSADLAAVHANISNDRSQPFAVVAAKPI